jgi:predicted DNA-binding transcriptional regulator YafY
MQYQRSLDIDQRLQTALRLIRSGGYSAPMLAEQLGVSIPTVSRDVTALRDRGHEIRSERKAEGWRYVLAEKASSSARLANSKLREARL